MDVGWLEGKLPWVNHEAELTLNRDCWHDPTSMYHNRYMASIITYRIGLPPKRSSQRGMASWL